MIGLICIKGLLTVAKIYLIMLYFYLTSMFFSAFYNKHAQIMTGIKYPTHLTAEETPAKYKKKKKSAV